MLLQCYAEEQSPRAYETILRLDRLILPLGTLGLLGRPLQTLLPMVVQAFPFLVDILQRLQA